MDYRSHGSCGPLAMVERPSSATVVRIAAMIFGAIALPFLVLYAAGAFDAALTSLFVAHHLGF